jgi:hypothetical protein
MRRLGELPEPAIDKIGTVQAAGCRVDRVVLKPEAGIYLPALLFVPRLEVTGAVLYVHERGKALAQTDPAVQTWIDAGKLVLAVDLRGMGETGNGENWAQGSANYRAAYTAYLLGRSLVGMRAEDILVCSRYLAGQLSTSRRGIDLVAVGNVTVPALHAAALEGDLFASVTLRQPAAAWAEVVRARPPDLSQLANAVHGVLRAYDLPDLSSVLADKLKVEE